MKRFLGALGVCMLVVSALAAPAHAASVDKTCAALEGFANDGAITDPTARLAAGRAHLRDAERAADKSGDRKLAVLARRFRNSFNSAIKQPNSSAAQQALDKAGATLWRYCTAHGAPIRRSTPKPAPPTIG